MRTLLADLRYGLRLLRQAPGFTLIAICALGLGIGANTAIFSTLNAVLLRPLPYDDPDRVMMVFEDASSIGFSRSTPAPANYFDWREQNHVFTDMAATRALKNLLYGVSATDPMTLGAVAALLTLISLTACWIPAQRASRLDPIVVLREE